MLRDVSRPASNLLGFQFMAAVCQEAEGIDFGLDV
jgi:hypothetical protein